MRIKNNHKSIIVFIFTIQLFTILGCKKLVELDPPVDRIVETNVYTVDGTSIAVLNSIYTDMGKSNGQAGFTGSSSLSVLAGLSADELAAYSGVTNFKHPNYYTNTLNSTPPQACGSELWQPIYNYLYRCNAAIEGLRAENAIASLTPVVRKQLLGEALFLRAFFYFYLVNLFGDVPLATTTDYEVNRLLHRSPVSEVYHQIKQDLLEARPLLSDNFLNGNLTAASGERVRPSKHAATALLARVYLFNEEFSKAESEATTLIGNVSMFNLPGLGFSFIKNSTEAIWQIQPSNLYYNTEEARTFVIPASGPTNSGSSNPQNPVYLSLQQLAAFEMGDKRAIPGNWIGQTTVGSTNYYFPFKYKVFAQDTSINSGPGTQNMTEYLMVFRLAEQYLIRAEARAKQNNLSGAIADIDMIRARAELPLIVTTNPGIGQTALLNAILHERQVELFTEWGHRWLDLKRTGQVNAVMSVVTTLKGGTWESTDQLYPILLQDILNNPNLTQNPGYQ